MAASSVEPERGSPEIRWTLAAGEFTAYLREAYVRATKGSEPRGLGHDMSLPRFPSREIRIPLIDSRRHAHCASTIRERMSFRRDTRLEAVPEDRVAETLAANNDILVIELLPIAYRDVRLSRVISPRQGDAQ